MTDDRNVTDSLDLFNPPSETQAVIDLARQIKKGAEKRAQERDSAIAAMPPPQRIDTYTYMREV